MLSKAFVRLTRKKKIFKVVQELYLRKDIFCGSELCEECYSHKTLTASHADGHITAQRLSGPTKKGSGSVTYLVVDTNIVLHQMDLLNKPQVKNFVILQTVLNEVKNQSPQLYNEIRELCADEERQFYVFSNEFREETHIERQSGESPNDRNDRAIRVAAAWYQEHLKTVKCKVILITNDRQNAEKARAEGIVAMTIHEYVKSLNDPDLLDSLAQSSSDHADTILKSQEANMAPIYEDHWTESEVTEALKKATEKQVFQGILRQNQANWLEAIIPLSSSIIHNGIAHDEVLISGRIHMNRAINGDIVLIQLLPQEEWQSPSNYFVDVDAPDEEILAFEMNDAKGKGIAPNSSGKKSGKSSKSQKTSGNEVKTSENELKTTSDGTTTVPTGRVVAVIRKNWRPYVGTLELPTESSSGLLSAQDLKQAHQLIFVPLDRRIPKIKVVTRQYESLQNMRVVVSIDGWDNCSLMPYGHYVRNIGPVGDKNVEAEALLQQHDLHMRPFSKQVMAELPPKDSPIVADPLLRLDLRHELICSIDPPGCTDIDDALHCKLLPNGNYQLGVHIADVSHYVKEGSHMDREARKRGNTIYLVDRRIDMLPRELGEDLCSINSNVDRYAFTVLWEVTPPCEDMEKAQKSVTVDKDGEEVIDDGFGVRVVDVTFHKTVIRSIDNLTYAAAQAKIDDVKDHTPLTQNLRILNRVAKVLKRRRIENGALFLASPQVKFVRDESNQDPVDVEMYETKETNSLVEEFMLLANIAVAQQITKIFPAFALLRRHPPPNQTKFDALAVSMKRFGVKLDTASSKKLSESLEDHISRITKGDSMDTDDATGGASNDPFFNKLLRIMVTRCMNTARYFSSGTLVPSQFHHYGLAAPIYTHFTSPIRRYADVVVHRLLAASINYSGLERSLSAKDVQRTSDMINRRHRMAEYAGRDSVRYHTIQYFRGKVMPVQPAYVMALAANGFDVLVPRYGVEGKVYLGGKGALSNSSDWTFIPHEQRLVHKDGKTSISMFDCVQVELSVDDQKAHSLKLAFRCVSPSIHESFSLTPVAKISPDTKITESPASSSTSNTETYQKGSSKTLTSQIPVDVETPKSKNQTKKRKSDATDSEAPPSKKSKN